MKNYEMTNHLGNVQATVLDKYTPRIKNPSDTAYTLWGSNISTATDYYAFGSPMPGRATQDTVTQSFVATTPFSTTSTIVIDSVEGNTSHFAWTAFGPTSNIGFITTPTTQITNNLGCPANPVSFMNPYGVRLQVNNLQPNKSYKLYVKYKASFAEAFSLEQITPNPPFAPIVLQSNASNSSKAVLYLPFTTNATASPVNIHLVYHAQCNYVTIDSVMLVSDTTVVGYVTTVLSEKSQKDDYRFSVNGQHKENEIAGYGNHTSALFWEYSTQLGRRWNVDPVDQISISNYATFGNNPITNTDVLGNIVKGDKESGEEMEKGLKANLGEKNPFKYNNETNQLDYDENFDVSKYTKDQLDLVDRYKTLVKEPEVTSVKMVDRDENIPELSDIDNPNGRSLKSMGDNGVTVGHFTGLGTDKQKLSYQNIYIARDPAKNVTSGNSNDLNGNEIKGGGRTRIERMNADYIGIIVHHEIAGHGFLNLTKPTMKDNEHNMQVEIFHKKIQKFYRVNGGLFYKNADVPEHPRYID